MRSISAGLAAAQAVRSPKAAVTATLSTRGQNPEAPALEWSELVPPAAFRTTNPAAGAAFPGGNVVRIVGAPFNLKVQTITDPTDAIQWRNNGWTTMQSVTANALVVYRYGSAHARLSYISNGNIYYMNTSDGGASWGSPSAVYTGGDAKSDICCVRPPASHDIYPFMVYGYSTYDGATGTYAAHFTAGSHYKYADGWRVAGVYIREGDDTYVYCLVTRQPDTGPSRLRVLRFDGATFDEEDDIDQTQSGLFGLHLDVYKFFNEMDTSALVGVALEDAYQGGNYEGIAGVFWNNKLQADEPVVFPDILTYNDRIYSYIVKNGDGYYYFGETFVYRGISQSAGNETLFPIAYVYDDHQIELRLPQDAPTVVPGNILTLRRSLSWDESSGTEEVAFYVVRVARSRREVSLTGVDAVGYLGLARCHRPAVLNDGAADGLAAVMRRLGARFGMVIDCDDSGLESADVMPVTVQPSESLLGAAYRVTSQSNAWIVPKNDGSFAATMINPGASDSGDYADTPHVYPNGEWTLIDAVELRDYRRLAFTYVLGTYSTEPSDGAYVSMARGPALPNTRPLPYSLTNTRYNTVSRVDHAAAAEAQRQKRLAIDAIVEVPANLALEVHDMVSVTEPSLQWSGKRLRVRRIHESWQDGRLTQTLYLGDESL